MAPKPSLEPSLEPSEEQELTTTRARAREADGQLTLVGTPSTVLATAPSQALIDSYFGEFWNVYPRKAGKRDAQAKFAVACRGVNPRIILDAACRYRDDPNRKPEFTKHPATWLNQGCWDDDPLPAPTPELGTTDQRVMSYLADAMNGPGVVPLSSRELARQFKAQERVNGHTSHTELERGTT